MGSLAERTLGEAMAGGPGGQGSCWWSRWSYIHVWIDQEEQLGSETDCTTQGSRMGK